MKIALCADVHIGNHRKFGGVQKSGVNQRCRLVLDVLKEAVKRAQDAGCSDFFILGDLFDDAKPSPQIIGEVGHIFAQSEMTIWPMLGNHDQVSGETNDHALYPLSLVRNCRVVSGSGHHVPEMSLMPFHNQPSAKTLEATLKSAQDFFAKQNRVLGVHMGVATDDTPDWLLKNPADFIESAKLAKIAKKYGIGTVFAGNWHNRLEVQHGNVSITQIGALCPTGFDNPGLGYGYVDILDTHTGNRELLEIPGPRFLSAHYNQHWEIQTNSKMTFLRMKCRPNDLKAATAYVQDLKASEGILDGEVVVEQEDVRQVANEAVKATNEGFTQELVKFVEELGADPARKAEVLAKVTEYLNKAGK